MNPKQYRKQKQEKDPAHLKPQPPPSAPSTLPWIFLKCTYEHVTQVLEKHPGTQQYSVMKV